MLTSTKIGRIKEGPVARNAENFDLRAILLNGRHLNLKDRMRFFGDFLDTLRAADEYLMRREVVSAADREVSVVDRTTGKVRKMLMFGSNNYLGLAGNTHVRESAKRVVDQYGAGVGGPPLLNGYTSLHRRVESRLAEIKGTEDALLFSSGYGANVGITTALLTTGDVVFYDAYSHASFYDGLKLTSAKSYAFKHNDTEDLARLLALHSASARDIFIAVEGIYSMDGDIAPLPAISALSKQYGAYLIVDDAHGFGVLGKRGSGTAESFGMPHEEVAVSMGTFSKTLAVSGGFVCASREMIEHMRYFARSYMFSASIPPPVLGAVLGGLEVMEAHPELMLQLRSNVEYALSRLQSIGLDVASNSAIIPVRIPIGMKIRMAARMLDQEGIFVNSIEYPAVASGEERFRISIMATHTKSDIDRMTEAFGHVWQFHYSNCAS